MLTRTTTSKLQDRELYSQWRFQRVDKSASSAVAVVECDLYLPYEIDQI
jgi:hypothetical protein